MCIVHFQTRAFKFFPYHSQLHGPERSSSVVALGGGDEYFQEGEEDSFPISLPCLFLPLCSLTLSHDNTGPYPEWHVQKVAVENRNTGECFAFNCGRYKQA